MKHRVICLVLLVVIGLGLLFTSAAARPIKPSDYATNSCSRFAYTLERNGGKPTSASFATAMRIKGCDRGSTLYTWNPVRTRCMNLARLFTLGGVHGLTEMQTSMKPYGCYWTQTAWKST